MKSYRSLVWKELNNQKITSVLILIAIILSTIMTTVIGQSLGILSALRQQQAAALNGNRYVTFHQLTQEQKEKLAFDHRLSFSGSFINIGTSLIPNTKLSIWLREYEEGTLSAYPSITQLSSGRLPQARNEVALPQDALNLLNYSGKLGDHITLPIRISLIRDDQAPFEYKNTFTLTGILKSNYLGYVSGGVNGIAGQGTAEQLLPKKYQLYSTDARMINKNDFQKTVDDIAAQFALPEYCIQYNDILLAALGIDYTNTSDDSDNGSGFPFMAVASILVGTLVLLASGLVIYNILKISVTKRIREYGTLRALGAERSKLYILVSLQLALLCGIGIPAGIILGILFAKGITISATSLLSPDLFLTSSSEELAVLIAKNSSGKVLPLIISTVITLLFAYLAAFPAARYAAKVSPTLAMSGPSIRVGRKNRKARRIQSFEAFYARMNMKRNKGRTAITILSLFMSITVFIALQSFSTLLDTGTAVQKMHIGDYSITNKTTGFSPEVVKELKSLSDITSVSTMKYSLYTQDSKGQLPISTSFSLQPGEALHIIGVDEDRLKMIAPALTQPELQDLKAGKACIIKNPIAINYGETRLSSTLISVGDTISVNNLTLQVLHESSNSITLDNDGFVNGVQIIVYDTIYDQITGTIHYSELYPVLSPNADKENVEKVIAQIIEQAGGGQWLSYQDTDKQLAESYQQIKLLAWGLILFIGLIGILNIINTVYTNIHTRITEIGVQRAIGMSIASLYKTFLWEGAYYGIIAAIAGSIAGYSCSIFISAAKTDTIELIPVPILPIMGATFISIVVCLTATCIPLRKIANMSIVDSIETVE
ncbi:ABC transporter permease [Paenibacillus graminis]|uniref:ABC transporter permease n=2 Tax=Paenibacillus graminis TaxID=189425 RepID=UPI002DB7685B|nr:ABC transporter permease [Paenibacillus graminis]MEC0170022.1 ABC transporter permease [Paenibacillus graminis]